MAARQNDGVLAQRKEALEEKAVAAAESRQLKMELEKERAALQQAEANCEFLVRETSRSRRSGGGVSRSLVRGKRALVLSPSRSIQVRESAQLKTARDEVVYSLELATKESQRLKEEEEKGKLTRVMGRYMIRKMREKLTVVQASSSIRKSPPVRDEELCSVRDVARCLPATCVLPTHSPRCRRGTSAWRRATSSCTPSS